MIPAARVDADERASPRHVSIGRMNVHQLVQALSDRVTTRSSLSHSMGICWQQRTIARAGSRRSTWTTAPTPPHSLHRGLTLPRSTSTLGFPLISQHRSSPGKDGERAAPGVRETRIPSQLRDRRAPESRRFPDQSLCDFPGTGAGPKIDCPTAATFDGLGIGDLRRLAITAPAAICESWWDSSGASLT